MKRATLVAAACLVIILAVPFSAMAQDTSGWSTDSRVNTLLLKGGYYGMAIDDDGAGGVIIAWAQSSYSGSDIYAQRLDKTGARLWSSNGVAVCTAEEDRHFVVAAGDGSGGAILAWSDFRGGSASGVYAQKLDPSGNALWTAGGSPVYTAVAHVSARDILSDGVGGAFMAWSGFRDSGGYLFVQKINSAGEPQWGVDGVSVLPYSGASFTPTSMINDGAGGVILVSEGRGQGYSQVCVARVGADGSVHWRTDGAPLYSTPTYMPRFGLVSDDCGGAIMAWTGKYENGEGIFAQRFDGDAQPLWGDEGILVQLGGRGPVMVSDGSGGALVAWNGEATSSIPEPGDIYAQRLDPDGTPAWQSDGLPICTARKSQVCPVIVSDGSNGAIIAWQDGRDSEASDQADRLWTDEVNVRHNDDICAQRVDSSGEVLWASNGVPVCNAPHLQTQPMMKGCGSGSAILIWADYRDYPLEDMHTDFNVAFDWYGQRVNASGALGPGSGGHAGSAGLPIWAWIAIGAGALGVLTVGFVFWRRMARRKQAAGGTEQG